MSEQSGCDPLAAVNARLRHLLVENPSVTVDPLSGAVLVKPDLSDEEYEKLRETWVKFNPRIGVVVTQPVVYIPMGDPGDETDHKDTSAFSTPCDWCAGDDVKLDEDGTCPTCGYDW